MVGRPVLLKVHKAAAMASLRIDLCTKQAKVTRIFREGRAECGEADGERTLTTDPLASGELIFTSFFLRAQLQRVVSALRFAHQDEISTLRHRFDTRQTSEKSWQARDDGWRGPRAPSCNAE